jgi:hypothetical protein
MLRHFFSDYLLDKASADSHNRALSLSKTPPSLQREREVAQSFATALSNKAPVPNRSDRGERNANEPLPSS